MKLKYGMSGLVEINYLEVQVMKIHRRSSVLILFLILIKSSLQFDDATCDRQLSSFDSALEAREFWAQKCKNLREKFVLNFKVILLQCLTRGPSSHRDFFMAMIAIQDISPSALNFVMKIFKVNIACLHQKLRPRISLRQVLESIGATLE